MTGNKKIKIFLQATGLLIFVYILSRIDYQILFGEIKLLKWHFLIITIILMVVEIIFRALRWRIILSSLDVDISKTKALSLFWLGTFFSVITPGRIGELIKVYFLKTRGASVFRSFFSVVLDRLIDIAVILFFGFLVFWFSLRDIGIYMIFLSVVLFLLIIFIFLIIDQRTFFHRIFGGLIQKIFPIDFDDYNRFTFERLWQGVKNLKKRKVAIFFVYLSVGWLLYFLAKYSIALSLGLNLSFVNLAIVSVLIIIANILPISINGLGTREAIVIYFFSLFGISKEVALLFSLMVFAADILMISFGLIPYLRESALINNFKKI